MLFGLAWTASQPCSQDVGYLCEPRVEHLSASAIILPQLLLQFSFGNKQQGVSDKNKLSNQRDLLMAKNVRFLTYLKHFGLFIYVWKVGKNFRFSRDAEKIIMWKMLKNSTLKEIEWFFSNFLLSIFFTCLNTQGPKTAKKFENTFFGTYQSRIPTLWECKGAIRVERTILISRSQLQAFLYRMKVCRMPRLEWSS